MNDAGETTQHKTS